METIIATAKNKAEAKAVLDLLKRMKVKAKLYQKPTREEVLESIGKSAAEAKLYMEGKIKLQNAFDLYNEL